MVINSEQLWLQPFLDNSVCQRFSFMKMVIRITYCSIILSSVFTLCNNRFFFSFGIVFNRINKLSFSGWSGIWFLYCYRRKNSRLIMKTSAYLSTFIYFTAMYVCWQWNEWPIAKHISICTNVYGSTAKIAGSTIIVPSLGSKLS